MRRSLSILLLLSFWNMLSYGQKKNVFTVTGKVILESGVDREVAISAFFKGSRDIAIKRFIKSSEPFVLSFEYNCEYDIEFSSEDFYTKTIALDTHVDDMTLKNSDDIPPFPMVVSLFQRVDGVDDCFTKKPVGKIFFDEYIAGFVPDVYVRDYDIKSMIKSEKLKAKQESVKKRMNKSLKYSSEISYDMLDIKSVWVSRKDRMTYKDYISLADSLYDKRMYNLARFFYVHAIRKTKSTSYCDKQIRRCQRNMEMQMVNLKKQELLALEKRGDSLFKGHFYGKARFMYQKAQQKAPLDRGLEKKILSCDRMINP
ncbi:hypothetical protein OAT16_11430 [Prolixibacteraceae bacterium]|nr:hypothetical protein [Prolixibacteraceae bacterium]